MDLWGVFEAQQDDYLKRFVIRPASHRRIRVENKVSILEHAGPCVHLAREPLENTAISDVDWISMANPLVM